MVHLDYYQTLGVSAESSDEEIKKSYRKLVLQYHPDRNHGNPEAEAKIREINAAYEILGDPETRKSYERLRYGGFSRSPGGYERDLEETVLDPDMVLRDMEKKLWDEGRREVFGMLMKNLEKIRAELSEIRIKTVELQGYDTFQEDMVIARGTSVMPELVNSEMEEKKQKLVDVAVHMMLSQGVGNSGSPQDSDWLKKQLEAAYHQGRIDGYCEACELLYVRK